jgi:membrane-bound serine protease (ClpP class)
VHHAFLFMPLIGLLLFFFLPWPYALALYIPIAGVSFLGYWKALQVQRQPPAVGTRAMIGGRADVISSKGEEIEVRHRGEIWRAASSQTLQRGQAVVIEDVDGLTLRVVPLSQPAENPVQ